MSGVELKVKPFLPIIVIADCRQEGLTAEEIASKEPEESAHIQLECHSCGNDWWTSRDEASTLTIDGPSSRNVGTAPLATAKFEDVEKLASPCEHEKSANDLIKKTTEAKMPVLDNQRSFNKSRTEDYCISLLMFACLFGNRTCICTVSQVGCLLSG
ncbi:hypothetical protein POM88_052496 [Heracleum sosnowskyi]|uniref:Uncharacterized protein n=1 Tax=Heracleum sosnowskyi TaxID=360622 RepID=A0AAD8GRR9_9APIA|nr:hypothetical protein POM88_052496 [Heracleum sosnowskyi]